MKGAMPDVLLTFAESAFLDARGRRPAASDWSRGVQAWAEYDGVSRVCAVARVVAAMLDDGTDPDAVLRRWIDRA